MLVLVFLRIICSAVINKFDLVASVPVVC